MVGTDTLHTLAVHGGRALARLGPELANGGLGTFAGKLGVPLPAAIADQAPVIAAADRVASAAAVLAGASSTVDVVQGIADTADAVDDLASALRAAVDGAPLPQDLRDQLTTFVEQLALRTLDHLAVEQIAAASPTSHAALALLGLLDAVPIEMPTIGPAASPGEPSRNALHFDRLGALLGHPDQHFRDVYGWGTSDFDARSLFTRLQRLLLVTGPVQAVLLTPAGQSPLLEAYIFGFSVDESSATPGVKVSVRFAGAQTTSDERPLVEPWSLRVSARGAFVEDIQAVVRPPFEVELKPPAGTIDIDVNAALVATPAAGSGPVLLLGTADGTRLTAERASLSGGFAVTWDPAANRATGEPTLDVALAGGHLVLSVAGLDGFLASVLPGTIDLAVDLEGQWRPSTGLVFKGGAALTVGVPVNARIGPAQLRQVDLVLQVGDALALQGRITGDLTLGPFTATLAGVGAGLVLRFTRGNLGPIDFDIDLLPPNGLGLAVNAGPVKGGGFIGYDDATGRYSGEFTLQVGPVGVAARGLLDTRIPGQSGYALLVQLAAAFPAVQVGFGFALTSVGGLLALNRRIDVDALRSRLAAGTAFADPAATFPVAFGVSVVGPTIQVIWARLVTFDVGIFLELPGPRRVVLLGRARCVVENPSGGDPYLQIRLDVLGELDHQKSTVAFDAALVDSTLLEVLVLTGGAAFRMSYGADPYVVLTVGGFHPGFSPSPLVFPASLTRIAMTRGTTKDSLCLRFEGYFAVTTNTVQFGASVEAIVTLGSFDIRGTLAFDALVERSPFHFTCVLHASVHVRWKGRNIGGLDLSGELSGPGPVVFRAKVSFDILFCTISFNHTFRLGSSVPATLGAIDSALAILVAELDQPDNLRAAGTDGSVVLAAPPSSGPPVVTPAGQLVWSQRRAPLDLLLEKVDGAPVARPETIRASGDQVEAADTDWFASGAFATLTESDALSRPAFERLAAGVRLGAPGTDDGPARTLTVTIKQIRVPAPPAVVSGGVFPQWFATASAQRLGAAVTTKATPTITVSTETWQVIGAAGDELHHAVTQAQAHQIARVTGTSVATAVPASDRVEAFAF
jgi:hypothetical protein